MISYIFKNKTKNILVIIFSVVCMIKPLCEFLFYISINQVFPWFTFLTLLPVALVLIYLLTLYYNYKFKSFMIPAAFLIWIVSPIYLAFSDIKFAFMYLKWIGEMPLTVVFTLINMIVLIIAKALCFAGSLSNFKNISLFKVGIILNIVGIAIITPIYEAVSAIEYFGTTNIFLDQLRQILNDGVILGRVANILFWIGLLLLAFNKKGEDIDITPYIEERKAKKQAKKEAKLQQKEAEEAEYNAPLPEIPDGSWRCMACGKILPDSIDRCECGYKK